MYRQRKRDVGRYFNITTIARLFHCTSLSLYIYVGGCVWVCVKYPFASIPHHITVIDNIVGLTLLYIETIYPHGTHKIQWIHEFSHIKMDWTVGSRVIFF